jgi:hypothetical protein
LTSRDGVPAGTSLGNENQSKDPSSEEFLASFQESIAQVTPQVWRKRYTRSRRELATTHNSQAPLEQTVGLQYTRKRMGVNNKFIKSKELKRLLAARYSRGAGNKTRNKKVNP